MILAEPVPVRTFTCLLAGTVLPSLGFWLLFFLFVFRLVRFVLVIFLVFVLFGLPVVKRDIVLFRVLVGIEVLVFSIIIPVNLVVDLGGSLSTGTAPFPMGRLL